MQANEAETGGRQTFAFEVVAERAHGARAGRSNRYEQNRVDLILLQHSRKLPRCTLDAGWWRRTHEGVMHGGDRADHAFALQLV